MFSGFLGKFDRRALATDPKTFDMTHLREDHLWLATAATIDSSVGGNDSIRIATKSICGNHCEAFAAIIARTLYTQPSFVGGGC
jgi:hypothetical protein